MLESLLCLLARFPYLQADEERDDQDRKVRPEQMAGTPPEGPRRNCLVERSAGSGNSNTIAWLTDRLASLHDEGT